jgi:hypothetical protein
MKSVIPRYPVNNGGGPVNNNFNGPLRQIAYKPPCSQYNGVRDGGIIYTGGNVYGNCSPNSGGQFGAPYDFVCDSRGHNCTSPQGNSPIYFNVDTYCCRAGNRPNNNFFNPYPPPFVPPQPRPSDCCKLGLNDCALCLTRQGFINNSNESANHFNNMQICRNRCMQHRNSTNLL